MISQDAPGSRWWSIDFHAHSPASFDFNGLEGHASASKPTTDEWMLAYMRSPLDGLVVTDHNTHDGIDAVRKSLGDLKAHPDFREIVIFPGVEVTTHGGFHLLAVFDPSTDSDTVTGLLHRSKYLGTRGDSNGTTEASFDEVVKFIVDLGGIAIPAHADAAKGIFDLDRRNIKHLVESQTITAVEVTTDDGATKAKGFGWIPVLGSDAHHLDVSGARLGTVGKAPGTHFTWAKMETLNLLGVQLAIADGNDSIIRAVAGDENPNEISHSAISKIRISSGGEETTCLLNPWMNSVIGGRGVGKSTIVEMLRLVMGRCGELPSELASDLSWFSPLPPRASEARAWDEATSVDVEYVKDNDRYRISWTGESPSEHKIEVWENGAWAEQPGSVADRFPIQVYSQKQIYETARDPRSLLRVIDSQTAIGRTKWNSEFEELCTKYRRIRSEILELQAVIRAEDDLRGELADVESRLARLSALGDSPELAELDVLVGYQSDFEANESVAQDLQSSLTTALADFESSYVTPTFSPLIRNVAERARQNAVASAFEQVKQALTELDASATTWLTGSASTPAQTRIAELRAWSLENEPEGSAPGEDLQSTREQQKRLKDQLEEVDKKKILIESLAEKAKESLNEVEEHRAVITERRRTYVESLKPVGQELKIDLYAQGDLTDFESAMRGFLQKPASFDSVFGGDKGLALGFQGVNPRNPKFSESVRAFKDFLIQVARDGKPAAVALVPVFGLAAEGRFYTHLDSLDAFVIETELNLWFPEDTLHIRYKPEGASNFKNVDEGSPGQKTAALLALVLQMGKEPLILDQPEDDLENRLVFDLVVQTLRRIKSSRQILVATHNANVVVNGDSEHVLVLEHGPTPVVAANGTIQTKNIKDSVCGILEGGEKAIEARYRRLVG